jgi:hypothetical protein
MLHARRAIWRHGTKRLDSVELVITALDLSTWTIKDAAPVLAALVGLLGAIFSVALSSATARHVARLQSSRDTEKAHSVEMLKQYLAVRVEGRDRQITAFQEILSSVQMIRDKARRVLADPESFGSKSLQDEFSTLSEDLSKAYSLNQIFLDKDDVELAHKLKQDGIELAMLARRLAGPPGTRGSRLTRVVAEKELQLASHQEGLRERARNAISLLADEIQQRARISEPLNEKHDLLHS